MLMEHREWPPPALSSQVFILRGFKFNKPQVLILRELRASFRACIDSPEVSGSSSLKIETRGFEKQDHPVERGCVSPMRCGLETDARVKVTTRIGGSGETLPKSIRDHTILLYS